MGHRVLVGFVSGSSYTSQGYVVINTLRPGTTGRHFADDIFKCTLLNEKFDIRYQI